MVEPKSLTQIISEKDFLVLAEVPCEQFFNVLFLFKRRNQEKKDISRKFYSNLIQESESLENFMDQYGARENKKWSFFVECLASIRNLSIAAFFTRHILDRYPYYNLKEPSNKENEFKNASIGVLLFLNQSILSLLQELYAATKSNSLDISIDSDIQIEFSDIECTEQILRHIEAREGKTRHSFRGIGHTTYLAYARKSFFDKKPARKSTKVKTKTTSKKKIYSSKK